MLIWSTEYLHLPGDDDYQLILGYPILFFHSIRLLLHHKTPDDGGGEPIGLFQGFRGQLSGSLYSR